MRLSDLSQEQCDFIEAMSMKYFRHVISVGSIWMVPELSNWQQKVVNDHKSSELENLLNQANREFSEKFYEFYIPESTQLNVICDINGNQMADKTFRALIEFDMFLRRSGAKSFKDILFKHLYSWVKNCSDLDINREEVLEILRIPKFGEHYIHNNGITYTVMYVSNTEATSEKYIPEVFYVGQNGKQWSKNLVVFKETMRPI